jgi:glycerol-3-phosphate dehydrogenase
VAVTNLVAKPEMLATIEATGSIVNTFLPGIGSMAALLLGGLYHGYRQTRNRRVNEALVQGVETARAVLTTTPQGQAADAAFVKWLMEHQKEAGVFTTVSGLVDQLTDNPAAEAVAREIAERVRRAQAGGV